MPVMHQLVQIKNGKYVSLYRRQPAPTITELKAGVHNFYIMHNDYQCIELGTNEYFVALSNFNMLEKDVLPMLESGSTIQDLGKARFMQQLTEAGDLTGVGEKDDDPNSKLH